jgi:hypothetical protein
MEMPTNALRHPLSGFNDASPSYGVILEAPDKNKAAERALDGFARNRQYRVETCLKAISSKRALHPCGAASKTRPTASSR